MALAKLTCGNCGAALTGRGLSCPQCNAKVEIPGAEPKRQGICKSCGFENDPAAGYCQSCGARLRGISEPTVKQQAKTLQAKGKHRDPWPYVALAALVVLVGIIVYTQWDRTSGSQSSTRTEAGSGQSSALPASPGANAADIFQAQQALAADPNNPGLMLRLANVLHDNGQYLKAVESYRKYLALHPEDPDARVDLGICYYQLGLADSSRGRESFGVAIREMREALRHTPRHQPAAFNLGVVFLQMENLDSSNYWFHRVVEFDKSSELGLRAQRILKEHAFIK
jgi:cytochrome c-type biogenesis protein CcmH/NrfG